MIVSVIGGRAWPRWLLLTTAVWLMVLAAFPIWEGVGAHRLANRLVALLVSAVITLAFGFVIGRAGTRRQGVTCAAVGSVGLAAANSFDALRRGGRDPLPWGVVVLANTVVVTVVVSALLMLGAGLGVASRRSRPHRTE
jgi:hypothetical protein